MQIYTTSFCEKYANLACVYVCVCCACVCITANTEIDSNRNNEGKFLFEVYTTNGWITSNGEKH